MLLDLHLLVSWLAISIGLASAGGARERLALRDPLPGLVTWDEYSLFVRNERLMIFSAEYHPFRLPVPGLWLDVFQKIKALGYSAVSFYVDWALLEGQPGDFRADGVFALEQFFDSAAEAGLYLIARPGPYINSEASGGGFPGWLARLKGELRSTDEDFINATQNYISSISSIIAKAQITNGGPIILFQPENEYTVCSNYSDFTDISDCLDKSYMAEVEKQYRNAGIELPFIVNDALSLGNFAPGSGVGAVDIYSFDSYPFGYGSPCVNPSNWSRSDVLFPTEIYNFSTHLEISPETPQSISEFQGGEPDAWGGVGVDSCAALINNEYERVIYKIIYSFRTAIFNIYMTFGGTNWGNLGHPAGYTSYDLGAAITEDRLVSREKYSEVKLEASFLYASPDFLTTTPDDGVFGGPTGNDNLIVTTMKGNKTSFYVVRQADYTSLATQSYRLDIPTSVGNLSIPQLDGSLSLHGRDSKIHVVDYAVGDFNLIYSTAEVFTWKKSGSKTVLLLYGGEEELHELAVSSQLGKPNVIEGEGLGMKQTSSSIVVKWHVTPQRRVISFGNNFYIYLLWRNDAYAYWPVDLTASESSDNYASPSKSDSAAIVKAGYLIRNAAVSDEAVYLYGDVNATTQIEVIAGAPSGCSTIFFNGQPLQNVKSDQHGRLSGSIEYAPPSINLPAFTDLDWSYVNSLPEVFPEYDDSKWTSCSHPTTNNPRNLTTPTSLYADDYGYHGGSLMYRGHFVADGSESNFSITTQGGLAFGYSMFLNSTHIASFPGNAAKPNFTETVILPELSTSDNYVITILMDHMGLEENFMVGSETMKSPRGILDFTLAGRDSRDIEWKMTGNLGGEAYRDHSRGPLNEGAMFAERQGYHLPGAQIMGKNSRSPLADGTAEPGVGFFAATFPLDIPMGWDIPLGFVFENTSMTTSTGDRPAEFRCQLFVNGWQFGKYINNIGPQIWYSVPEGILNHRGENYVALTIWSQEASGTKLAGLSLKPRTAILSGIRHPELASGARWMPREGAY